MVIKTITCHDVNNYGASLQAYALQKYLQQQGYDVEIIDYLPIYKTNRLNFFEYNRTQGRLNKIVQRIPFIKPLIGLYDHLRVPEHRQDFLFYKKKKAFNLFKKDKLICTNYVYRDIEDLKTVVPQADTYIAGSDQIWNVYARNGQDPAYYCDFAPENSRCISYAASFGTSDIPHDFKDFVSQHLKRFNSISVREKSGVSIVRDLGYQAIEVLDPVFLLQHKEWEKLCKCHHREKYLLVYDIDMNHPEVKKLSERIAKENNWKIYSINDFKLCPYADYNINNAGPVEFIEWIRDAQFIICTSFHGTAFSVIFNKQFYTFPLYKQNNNSRMEDFLVRISLSNHFVMKEVDNIDIIDYTKINDIIQQLVRKSQIWLNDNTQPKNL